MGNNQTQYILYLCIDGAPGHPTDVLAVLQVDVALLAPRLAPRVLHNPLGLPQPLTELPPGEGVGEE